MRKISVLLALLLAGVFCFGQTETEPNNTFNTGNILPANTITACSLGGGDIADYHKVDFSYNGNFYLNVELTNTGSTTKRLHLAVYNSLQYGDEYVGGMYFLQFEINPGETFSDLITLCGKAADEFIIECTSDGEFDYSLEWYPANVSPDDGYNNDAFATATPISFNIEEEGGIRYEYWGNTGFDSVDYFRATLPAADYGQRLFIPESAE